MNRFFRLSMAATGILVLLVAFGCSDDDPVSPAETTASAIARVYPADGTTGLSTTASVSVVFTGPVDTMSVMNNFHLLGGEEMYDWMDSSAHHGGVGHMSMRDMDRMMNWMDSIALPGTFSWNEAMDSCEFVTSSGMLANQEHMIFMYEGGMMDQNGGMMGSHHGDDQYHSYHFMTIQ